LQFGSEVTELVPPPLDDAAPADTLCACTPLHTSTDASNPRIRRDM